MHTRLDGPGQAGAGQVTAAQYRDLLRLAFVLCGPGDRAEDLVQDAFERCTPKLAGVDDPTRYLRTALVNRWRSQERRRQVAGRWLERQRPPAPAMPPQLVEWHDQLLALPPRQRAAIVLRYLCDLDDAAIGEVLGAPPSTVRSLVRRGLITLRKALHVDL